MFSLSSPVGVFSVGATWAQITWGALPTGSVTIECDYQVAVLEHPGGPGSHIVEGLPSGSGTAIVVTSPDGTKVPLTATTLAAPWGDELTRFATISDLHLGAHRWGFFKTMTEAAGRFADPHPTRCAKAAISEAQKWGADMLLIKGDAAHHEDKECFDILATLVDEFPDLPMMLIPGNHDVDEGADNLPTSLGRRALSYTTAVDHVDLPGIRVIAADTTKPLYGSGSLAKVSGDILERAAEADRPVFIGLHHQLQATKIPRYYPKGIPAPESTDFLDDLNDVQPNAVVSSGHTHRNRVRRHGDALVTEIASTKDWPGVWGAYTVHEGGICQAVRRVSEPSAMVWTEYSQRAVAGLWSKWSPGKLEDRCLSHVWARDPHLVG